MTHIPRSRPRIACALLLGFLTVFLILGWKIVSLIRSPPLPVINHCPKSDPANGWCLE